VLNVVKEGSQIKVDDFGLRLHNPLSYSGDRFMGGSFRPVAVRSRLEVSFENRLQDELQSPLDHAISDRRYGENANFRPPIFRNLLLPDLHGLIRIGEQFVPDLLQKTLHSALFDGFKRDPVDSRCPVVLLRHLVGFLKSLSFADMDVQSPETPGWFGLRLDV